jgi:hypothetical protein
VRQRRAADPFGPLLLVIKQRVSSLVLDRPCSHAWTPSFMRSLRLCRAGNRTGLPLRPNMLRFDFRSLSA